MFPRTHPPQMSRLLSLLTKNGDPDYQPSISQEELMKELNIK